MKKRLIVGLLVIVSGLTIFLFWQRPEQIAKTNQSVQAVRQPSDGLDMEVKSGSSSGSSEKNFFKKRVPSEQRVRPPTPPPKRANLVFFPSTESYQNAVRVGIPEEEAVALAEGIKRDVRLGWDVEPTKKHFDMRAKSVSLRKGIIKGEALALLGQFSTNSYYLGGSSVSYWPATNMSKQHLPHDYPCLTLSFDESDKLRSWGWFWGAR